MAISLYPDLSFAVAFPEAVSSTKSMNSSSVSEAGFPSAITPALKSIHPGFELASLLYEERAWEGVVYLTREALKITERPRTYVCEADSWGSLPWDLLSLGLYYTGRYQEAYTAVLKAAEISPSNGRIAKNAELMRAAAGK